MKLSEVPGPRITRGFECAMGAVWPLLDDDDRAALGQIIGRHLAETGSAVAQRLLDDWIVELPKFVKVMPEDYKRVLRAAAEAEAKGIPVDEAIMAASHG